MVAEETMNTAKARDPFARYENRESGRAAEILKRYEDEVRSGRGDQAVADIKPTAALLTKAESLEWIETAL